MTYPNPTREKVLGTIIYTLSDPDDRYLGRLLWHHCRDSRHCAGAPGIPDLIIAGPGGVIWAEVKPGLYSRLNPGQTSWRYMLEAAGELHMVWTAEDLADGTIRKMLDQLL